MHVRGFGLVAFVSVALSACGARDALWAGGDAGEGGASSGASSTSSSSGTGGAGGGPLVCPELRWAGDPVRVAVPFGGALGAPKLVRVSQARWAVAFEANDGAGRLVASFAVEDPFGAWPPITGAPDANLPTALPFAVGEGDPGRFAYAASDVAGNHMLGQAEPGQNGSTLVDWPASPAPMRFVSRSPTGAYAIGRGAGDTGLFVDLVPGFVPNPSITTVGMLGCASSVLAEAVPSPKGGFIVANTADLAFDDCLDPDLPGPPVAAQLHHVLNGNAEQRSAFSELSPVRELRLAPRPEGAWLGIAREGSQIFAVHVVDADGYASEPLVEWVGELGNDDAHDIAAIEDELAIAVVRTESFDGSRSLLLAVRQGFAGFGMVSSQGLDVLPSGAPSLGAQLGRSSLLVAVVDASQVQPTIALLRADCGLVGAD